MKTFPMWILTTKRQLSDPAQINAAIAEAWARWVEAEWMLQEQGGPYTEGKEPVGLIQKG